MVIFGFLAFLVACIAIDGIVQYSRKKKALLHSPIKAPTNILNESAIAVPKGLFFDKSHTWAFMEKNGEVRIGIDDFLLRILGFLSKIEMKSPGDFIQKGDVLVSLAQKGKTLTVNSPISGVVTKNNQLLKGDLGLMSLSPYEQGWIYTVEPLNWQRDSGFFLIADKYRDWLKMEFRRFKDFISYASTNSMKDQTQLVMQDGGEIHQSVMEEFGPEVWEDFQTQFLDLSR